MIETTIFEQLLCVRHRDKNLQTLFYLTGTYGYSLLARPL